MAVELSRSTGSLLSGLAALGLVWTGDINVELLHPRRVYERWLADRFGFIPLRREDALYLDGEIVGLVEGFEIDERSRRIVFREIRNAGLWNVLGQATLIFRHYRLRVRQVETMTGMHGLQPEKGRTLEHVSCEIVGAA